MNPAARTLDFYMESKGGSYYIFTRKYRRTLFNYFKNGVSIHTVFELKRAHGNDIVINTICQLKSALRYIEKENEIQIFDTRCENKPSYLRRKEKENNDYIAA